MKYIINEAYQEGITEIMEKEDFPAIADSTRQGATEKLIENQIKFQQNLTESGDNINVTGSGVANWDPILINMVRRSAPQLMAFDLAGVQPMSGPNGQVFAMRSRYTNQTGAEAFVDEANTGFSGTGTQAGDTSGFATDEFGAGDPVAGTATGTGMATADAEALGTTSGSPFKEMAFSIEKTSVEAVSRGLRASYSTELAQDLRAIHGLNAEQELGNILSTEIVSEEDRQLLRTINISAQLGATAGNYDVAADSDGRWMVERWKGLIFQLELEANAIGINTRRGRANRIIASSNVASALNMAGVLEYNPAYAAKLGVDPTGNTYAGMLLGKYAVYIDPYAAVDYVTAGYRGANSWDAGIYYCPYVALEMFRSIGEDSYQPSIAFKTRSGIVANPFAANTSSGAKAGKGLGQGENPYYRKFRVQNIAGG